MSIMPAARGGYGKSRPCGNNRGTRRAERSPRRSSAEKASFPLAAAVSTRRNHGFQNPAAGVCRPAEPAGPHLTLNLLLRMCSRVDTAIGARWIPDSGLHCVLQVERAYLKV